MKGRLIIRSAPAKQRPRRKAPRRPLATATTVPDYIAAAPPDTRRALRQIRQVIRKAAPGITERISYRIPTFDLGGKYLLYMAAFKDHVSVYPATAGMMAKYGERLTPYRSGAGTLRFALDRALPLGLIAKVVKQRVSERRASRTASKPSFSRA